MAILWVLMASLKELVGSFPGILDHCAVSGIIHHCAIASSESILGVLTSDLILLGDWLGLGEEAFVTVFHFSSAATIGMPRVAPSVGFLETSCSFTFNFHCFFGIHFLPDKAALRLASCRR
uniref:Putative secreted protein n=1 Tax=Panstrongylus lignarius TaxID=156445 RepID=A0A224Y0G3_9HEMI